MDAQKNIIPDNYYTVLQLGACNVHTFNQRTKKLVAQGSCEVLGSDMENQTANNSNVFYFKTNKYYETIRSTHNFVKISYPNTTSFLFQNSDMVIVAISFNKQQLGIDRFEKLLSQFCNVVEYHNLGSEQLLSLKIKQSCPDNIETEDILVEPKKNIKVVGKTIGVIFGKINGFATKPAKSIGTSVSERADRFSKDSISQQTKSKWNRIKQKSNNLNESITNIMRPVINGYYNLTDSIGERLLNSENRVIKTVREYSYAFADSLNQAERNTKNPVNQDKVLKEQGPSQSNLK